VNKEAARKCLVLADQFIRDGKFTEAQRELDKAKKHDPSNIYLEAFRERIAYFEEEKRKEASKHQVHAVHHVAQRHDRAVEEAPPAVPAVGSTPEEVKPQVEIMPEVREQIEEPVPEVEASRETPAGQPVSEPEDVRPEEELVPMQAVPVEDRPEPAAAPVEQPPTPEELLQKRLEHQLELMREQHELAASSTPPDRPAVSERVEQESERYRERFEELRDRLTSTVEQSIEDASRRQRSLDEANFTTLQSDFQRRVEEHLELIRKQQELVDSGRRQLDSTLAEKFDRELQRFNEKFTELNIALKSMIEQSVEELSRRQTPSESDSPAIRKVNERLESLEALLEKKDAGAKLGDVQEFVEKLMSDYRVMLQNEKEEVQRVIRAAEERFTRKAGDEQLQALVEEIKNLRHENSVNARAAIQQRKTEEDTLRSRSKNIREHMNKAKEFMGRMQFDHALLELSRLFALDAAEALEQQDEAGMSRGAGIVDPAKSSDPRRGTMNDKEMQISLYYFRKELERAWLLGKPDEMKAGELHEMASSLSIPKAVEQSLRRAAKFESFRQALKLHVGKGPVADSSTLGSLREIYDIGADEYAELEQKMLRGLINDQYRGTVVFVTEDRTFGNEVVESLSMHSYSDILVLAPVQALSTMEQINPQFILLDLDSSKSHTAPADFLESFRRDARYKNVPLIVFVGDDTGNDERRTAQRPNEAFLPKPINFDELNAAMKEKLVVYRKFVRSLNS